MMIDQSINKTFLIATRSLTVHDHFELIKNLTFQIFTAMLNN